MNKRKGFSLIEVMVVVLILSLLAVFVVPNVFKNIGKAKTQIARSQMAVIEGQLERFAIDCDRLPTDQEGLAALVSPPPGLEDKWGPKYLKESQIIDPWDNPYIYIRDGERNIGSYDLISLGADGQDGGEGENADIFND